MRRVNSVRITKRENQYCCRSLGLLIKGQSYLCHDLSLPTTIAILFCLQKSLIPVVCSSNTVSYRIPVSNNEIGTSLNVRFRSLTVTCPLWKSQKINRLFFFYYNNFVESFFSLRKLSSRSSFFIGKVDYRVHTTNIYRTLKFTSLFFFSSSFFSVSFCF